MRPLSLRTRLLLALVAALGAGAALHAAVLAALARWGGHAALLAGAAAVLALLLAAWGASRLVAPLKRLLRSLESAVLSYRDGDFSVSISDDHGGELGALVGHHNALGHALRDQRQHLAQRELLLDTVVQNTPVALVLTDVRQRVAYANIAARQLLGEGRSLEGSDFGALLATLPPALARAVEEGTDALFSVTLDGSDETFHLSQRQFRLQGRPHRLLLFRRMTRELSRQEVATWKRVIRVISHELNNSLAPISSLAHSGAELARRGDVQRLPEVFAAIGERARHLHGFLDGYARFAKLPKPRLTTLDWRQFVGRLEGATPFRLTAALPSGAVTIDATQMEQVMINLLKNAAESGSPPEAVELSVRPNVEGWLIEVADRGSGLSEDALRDALIPFYSTKPSGTGLGLTLCREIVEAHGGRVSIANRTGGGAVIGLWLPKSPPQVPMSVQ